ncbi:coiled-coil domain-containing protein [Hymenobacter crusticola]|uniref:Uncharacterized protein n=1 Tax=Hymenobacter crusticola TaxID=1770526 RepID=A0A243W5D1_9BACT|nr:hypothetical protein [Hymenobacter crusticola]OUJ67756.1 hypothetical protein BXP70_28570 [Hymenobacter crusticola]
MLGEKKWREHLNPQAYIERELARMNEHLARQVGLVNAKLAEVATVATANTLEHERAKILEKQLATSKKTQQQTAAALEQTKQELAAKIAALQKQEKLYAQVVVRTAQGEALSPALRQWATRAQEQSRQKATTVIEQTLRGPVTELKQVYTALQQNGYALQELATGQVLVRGQQSQALFALDSLQPNGYPLAEQLQQAITRTQREQEQARKHALAQDPRAAHVRLLAADTEQAHYFACALEQAGANVWQVQRLPDHQLEVRVSYCFDWHTIEAISQTLTQGRRTPGIVVEEDRANQTARYTALRTLERERTREQQPEQGHGFSL